MLLRLDFWGRALTVLLSVFIFILWGIVFLDLGGFVVAHSFVCLFPWIWEEDFFKIKTS